MAFETFNLANVLQTAEAIKGARRQSKLDELREISTRQQIDLQGQQARQAQTKFTEDTRLANTQWLANATDQVLAVTDPTQQTELLRTLGEEGKRRGVISPDADLSGVDMAKLKLLNQNAKLAIATPHAPLSAEGKRAADIKAGVLTPEQITPDQPTSVREYEFAKKDGFKGTYQQWVAAGGQSSRPSSVLEWDFYSSLPPEMQHRYLELKRNPNMVVKEVGGVPTVIAPTVSGTTTTPLSTLPAEAEAGATLAGATAAGKAKGEAQAMAQINLPQARADSQYMTKLLGDLRTHSGLPAVVGVKGVTNYLPGTPAADFRALLDQVGGRQFLEAFASLKGGGAITEIEGKKAEQAIARLSTAQTEQAFIAAVTEFEGIVSDALKRAEAKAKSGSSGGQPLQQQTSQPPLQEGATATGRNGQKLVLRNNQWVPLGQ